MFSNVKPFSGVLTGKELQLAERRGKAYAHGWAMYNKYEGNRPDAFTDDYHNWQEQVEVTGVSGNTWKETKYEYPLPYDSERYFRRFIELFLSRGSEDGMIEKLEKEFIGDEIDAEYIKGLLTRAEDVGLFNGTGFIAFYADASYTFLSSGATMANYEKLRSIPSCNVFHGSKTNNTRRKTIKKWLNKRAKELAAQAISQINPASLPLPPHTASLILASTSAETTSPIISAPTDDNTAGNIAGFFPGKASDESKISLCDRAAMKIGLTAGQAPKKSDSKKIHALARGLIDSNKASCDEATLRTELAKRYGVNYKTDYTPQDHKPGGNKSWAKSVVDVMQLCQQQTG